MHPDQHRDVGWPHRSVTVSAGIGQTSLVEESGHLGHQVGVDGLRGAGGYDQMVLELVAVDAGPEILALAGLKLGGSSRRGLSASNLRPSGVTLTRAFARPGYFISVTASSA